MNPQAADQRQRYRIAVVAACPFPTYQGSQVLIRQLSEALHQLGHEVHVVTYHFGESANEPMHFQIHRITRLIPYAKLRAGPSFRKPLLDLLLTARLLNVVNRYKIDIIHAHNYEALVVGFVVRAITGVKVVYHSHNAMIDELHTYFSSNFLQRVAKVVAQFLDRNLPCRADHCIALNDELVTYFESTRVASSKISCLPPGTFVEEFREDLKASNNFKELPLTPGKTVIYTGNLDSYQNLEVLLAAWSIVVQCDPALYLILVSHAMQSSITDLVASLGLSKHLSLIRTNSFGDVVKLLNLSDIAVIPRTSWSGFPIKLVNYMAAGKAIVAAEGSAKTLYHLHNGYVVKNFNVPELAEGILLLTRDESLRTKLGHEAAETARSNFNWFTICRELETIYARLTNRG